MTAHSYGDRIRIRVNGLLVEYGAVLLAQIHSPVTDEPIWTPPGGGLEFGETMEACLRREFSEETGLSVEVQELKFLNELLDPPYQTVEFYFRVKQTGGTLRLGSDPEHRSEEQFLLDVRWIALDEINSIKLAPTELAYVLTGEGKRPKSFTVFSSFI